MATLASMVHAYQFHLAAKKTGGALGLVTLTLYGLRLLIGPPRSLRGRRRVDGLELFYFYHAILRGLVFRLLFLFLALACQFALGLPYFYFFLSLVMGEECEMVVTVRGMDFVSAIWLRCVRPLTMDMESGFEI